MEDLTHTYGGLKALTNLGDKEQRVLMTVAELAGMLSYAGSILKTCACEDIQIEMRKALVNNPELAEAFMDSYPIL